MYWGVFLGSKADNSQILSTAVAVVNEAILLLWLCVIRFLAWILIRRWGPGEAVVSSFPFLRRKRCWGLENHCGRKQVRKKWSRNTALRSSLAVKEPSFMLFLTWISCLFQLQLAQIHPVVVEPHNGGGATWFLFFPSFVLYTLV